MSFSTRLALSIAVLVALCGVIGAAALVTIGDLHARLGATDERYDEIRGLYEIGQRAATARVLLGAPARNEAEIRRQLLAGLREADRVLESRPGPSARALHDIRA